MPNSLYQSVWIILPHYDRLLPPMPVELKMCEDYFELQPATFSEAEQAMDEIRYPSFTGCRIFELDGRYPP
eukprot:3594492-Amphidinium_carterae.1